VRSICASYVLLRAHSLPTWSPAIGQVVRDAIGVLRREGDGMAEVNQRAVEAVRGRQGGE
jgi:hypothetical protein